MEGSVATEPPRLLAAARDTPQRLACYSDWYGPVYCAVSPERDPQGPPAGERRASRGGAWRHAIKVSRCSARSSIPPGCRYNDYGFRVALNVDAP